MDRARLPAEPSGAPGRWKQDKEYRRATEAGELGEAEFTVEPNPERGSSWIPVVRVMSGDRGSLCE